jgi:cell division septation protein DedD
VHVESFPTRDDAERGARRYRESGEIVTIMEKEIPDKGIWYRVLLGRFPSKEDAEAHAEEAKETYGLSYALVVRTSP